MKSRDAIFFSFFASLLIYAAFSIKFGEQIDILLRVSIPLVSNWFLISCLFLLYRVYISCLPITA